MLTEEKIATATAMALSTSILAELSHRLGADFAKSVEARMNGEIDRRTGNGNQWDAEEAQAILEGIEMIEWDRVTNG